MSVSASGSIVVYHIPLSFLCIYGCSDERGENGVSEEDLRWDVLLRCVGEVV